MSLVGPRPTVQVQVDRYTERQRHRLDTRPGITGWAQVNGRASLPWHERIELDLAYLGRASLRHDLFILAASVRMVLTGHGLYRGETGGLAGAARLAGRPSAGGVVRGVTSTALGGEGGERPAASASSGGLVGLRPSYPPLACGVAAAGGSLALPTQPQLTFEECGQPHLTDSATRRYCTDQVDRFRKARTVFFFALAAADSRRLTRSVALSALPHAPVRRGSR